MSGSEELRDTDFEETRSTLSEGLKACRAVVQSYRDLMTDDSAAGSEHPPADNDEREPRANDLN